MGQKWRSEVVQVFESLMFSYFKPVISLCVVHIQFSFQPYGTLLELQLCCCHA